MRMELIDDIQKFFMLVGACNELSMKGFRNEEVMDDDYKETMRNLTKKYGIAIKDESLDEYYASEDLLCEKFTKIMTNAGD